VIFLRSALFLCLFFSLSVYAQPSSQPAKKRPWVVAPVPAIVISSDSGYGAGIQLDLYDHRLPVEPYVTQYEFVFTATSKKEQNYAFSIDKPQILGGDCRLKANASYERTPQSQFFGIGNESERDPILEDLNFYEYDRSELSADASLQKKMQGAPKISIVGQFTAKRYVFRTEDGSFFEEEQPLGAEGGIFAEWGVGLLRDTRDKEAWPTKGGQDELSLRGSAAPFDAHPYLGANLTLRRYLELAPKTTLGVRAAADVLTGDAPFFVQERFGLEAISSVGGSSSLRGFPRARFVGDKKFLTSAEIRALPWSTHLFGLALDLGGAAFIDAGKVFDEEPSVLHVGAGLGFRLVYEKDFVVRIDVAHSSEDIARVYLDVGHPF
jgi:outer membrane protein assembly factor BamA